MLKGLLRYTYIKTALNKLLKVWLLATFTVLILASPALAATDIPRPDANLYVLDQAGVMSNETKALIINTSQELNRQTKAQVAVVTLNSLNGQSIEDVALSIGRDWKLGDQQLNNGVVILLIPSERKSRIEVGYGLEGALPDGKTGRIQDQFMVPYFQKGDYDLGLRNGYLAVVSEVAKEYNTTINLPQYTPVDPTNTTAEKSIPAWQVILGVIGLVFFLWIDNRFFNGFLLGLIISTLLRGGGKGGGGGSSGGGGSFGGGGSSRNW